MHKLWIASLILAAPVASPEAVRVAIRDHPTYYCGIAIAFALFGGFVVQYHSWVDGKITAKKASSELMFSVLAGMIAFLVAASQGFDEIILYTAGLLGGMAGRRSALLAQSLAYHFVRNLASNALGLPNPPGDRERPPGPPP